MQVSNCNIMYKVATQCVCVCVRVRVRVRVYIYIYTWSKLQVKFFQDSEISDEQKAQNNLFDIETFKI